MLSPDPLQPEIPVPTWSEANNQALCLDSTLSELALYDFEVESHHCGRDVAEVFERYSALPGAIIVEQRQFLGMISRQRLLEYLIRPQGLELFLAQPLTVLYSYARSSHLILPDTTPILLATHQALRRSRTEHSEPIVVQTACQQTNHQTYRLLDIHELNIAYWQLRGIETQVRYEHAQTQMIQIEKMASLGRLVDGVAHEILDPVNFIWGNLGHVSTYVGQLIALLKVYEHQFPQLPRSIAALRTEIELDYLRQDLPQSLGSIKTGAERLRNLAVSLQNFCHIDEVYPKPADLHECLNSILLLLKSRLTTDIQIVRAYGYLPPVTCYAGQLGQVFMNILTNAIDALIHDAVINEAVCRELLEESGSAAKVRQATVPHPQITITTQVYAADQVAKRLEQDRPVAETSQPQSSDKTRWVSIRIADNGPGLTCEQRQQIIDSFSVEQRVAKETSLAMSYRIITAKHGGKLYLNSAQAAPIADSLETGQLNHGTEFEILLPLV